MQVLSTCSRTSETSAYTTHIKVKAETQYLAQYDESAYYYEDDHDGEEAGNYNHGQALVVAPMLPVNLWVG